MKVIDKILFIISLYASTVACVPAKKAAPDDRDDGDKIAALIVVVIAGAVGGFLLQAI